MPFFSRFGVWLRLRLRLRRSAPAFGSGVRLRRSAPAFGSGLATSAADCSAEIPQLFDPTSKVLTDPLGPIRSFRCFEFGIECDQGGRAPGPRTNCEPGGDWLYKVGDYIAFFQDLKPPEMLVIAAIAGPVTEPVEVVLAQGNPELVPSCESSMGRGVAAIRIKHVVEAFSANGLFNMGADICQPDYSQALKRLGTRIGAQLSLRCLGDVADTDPMTPEVDPDCTARLYDGSAWSPISACQTSAGGCDPCSCYRMRPHQGCARLGSGIAVEISSSATLPEYGIIEMTCKK